MNFDKYISYFYCFIISFVFMAVFSFDTSPFYPIAGTYDSGMFQVIGKFWSEGHLPYVERWSSKGPIIFFINALGYLLLNKSGGVL